MERLAMNLLAVVLFLPCTRASICYVGQEPGPGPGRYLWVLQGDASLDPCGCTAFRLGGVNTVPSDGGLRSFNVSELTKTLEEIRNALGCQLGEVHEQTFTTGLVEGGILFPFGQFAAPLRVTFQLEIFYPGPARLYLATSPKVTTSNRPPYMIEFRETEMAILKLQLSAPIHDKMASTTISASPSTRQFTVVYKYTDAVNGNPPTVTIEVVFRTERGESPVQYTDTNGQLVHYVGIFSVTQAKWSFLNP